MARERLLQRLWLRGMKIACNFSCHGSLLGKVWEPAQWLQPHCRKFCFPEMVVLGSYVKSWEGIFHRGGWNVPSKPFGPTTSSCTLRPCESSSQKETLFHHIPLCLAVQALWVGSAPFCRGNPSHTRSCALPWAAGRRKLSLAAHSLLCPTCFAVVT